MLTITLYTDELLHDIHERSHSECQAIADDAERYRVEAGTDKDDRLVREMIRVQSSLKRMMHRWLDEPATAADDTLDKPESFCYELNVTGRRGMNKAQPLTDACHDFTVAYTLARFYASVGMKDLSNAYSIAANDAGVEIDELLNSKLPPL